MTASQVMNGNFTPRFEAAVSPPGESDRNAVPVFDPAEFLDRIAWGEYRGNLADVVDHLSDDERLAAALLLADRFETLRKQRRMAETMKHN